MITNYHTKYLKYKTKYLQKKSNILNGGTSSCFITKSHYFVCNNIIELFDFFKMAHSYNKLLYSKEPILYLINKIELFDNKIKIKIADVHPSQMQCNFFIHPNPFQFINFDDMQYRTIQFLTEQTKDHDELSLIANYCIQYCILGFITFANTQAGYIECIKRPNSDVIILDSNNELYSYRFKVPYVDLVGKPADISRLKYILNEDPHKFIIYDVYYEDFYEYCKNNPKNNEMMFNAYLGRYKNDDNNKISFIRCKLNCGKTIDETNNIIFNAFYNNDRINIGKYLFKDFFFKYFLNLLYMMKNIRAF